MNAHIAIYQTIDGGTPIADMLALIARRAPELMRQGGGSLPKEQLWSGKYLDQSERDEIQRLFHEGKSNREIATLVNRSVKTVWLNTKNSRKGASRHE